MTGPLLERLRAVADQLNISFEVGLSRQTPPPDTYLVATPLSDELTVFADNTPGIEIEEARISLFTKTNYLALRDQITKALISARLVITARRYIGYEDDTCYHHYSIDIATYHSYNL